VPTPWAIDRAVLAAYGWDNLNTTCEFLLDYEDEESPNSKRKKPWRYRWPEATHDEVLARLLKLNQQRYEMEAIEGKKAQKQAPAKRSKEQRWKSSSTSSHLTRNS
jgi:hypothetical protein